MTVRDCGTEKRQRELRMNDSVDRINAVRFIDITMFPANIS